VRILFIARHFTYFRNYDSAIRELAARGHRIHLAVERRDKIGGIAGVEALARDYPTLTFGMVPERRVDTWSGVARRLRLGLDYIRYLDPFYDDAPLHRIRARERTPRLLIALANPPLVRGRLWRDVIGRILHALDRIVPPSETVVEYIGEHKPDAVLVTPLVDLGSQQIDYLRAARLLGIPSGLAVWSWDHLTSKARVREYPERVLVWNETQRDEAIRLHRVPPARVVVTGAQCFDRWFAQAPSRSREAFCASVGLPADRPLILWVCSGLVRGSPPEPPTVHEWLTWVRTSGDSMLEEASVLIRPHPSHAAEWQGLDWSALGPVAISGENPVDERSRANYFDALYHSAVVVGLNTSAFIEAGIVGREVLALLDRRFYDAQEGTPHFRYLLQIGGGLLRTARERDAHLAQLAAAIRRAPPEDHPHREFLELFVRPRGLDHPATPDFVAAVEELASCRVEVPRRSAAAAWRRAVLGGAMKLVSRIAGESLVRSPRELDPARQARIEAVRERRE